MSYASNFGVAAAMSLDVLIRSLGSTQVMLRLPSSATNTIGEQLGLDVPVFRDLPLSPVIIRQLKASECEVLVGARVMDAVAESLSHGSVRTMLKSICGVLVDDVLMSLMDVGSTEAGGVTYLYRLRLRTPDA
jgi:hypothetical protein